MRAVRTWTGARRIVLTKLQDPALVKCELIGTEQHAEQDKDMPSYQQNFMNWGAIEVE